MRVCVGEVRAGKSDAAVGHFSWTGWSVLGAVIGVIALSAMAVAQEAITPDAKTFNSHVVRMAPLNYSDIAKAAQVQGTVVVAVEVGTDGNVMAAKAISGPAALAPAAVDCAKQWKFRPFEMDGKKVPANGELSFAFGTASMGQTSAATEPVVSEKSKTVVIKSAVPAGSPEDEATAKFNALWKQCSQAVIHHTEDNQTVLVCKQAADLAGTFPPDKLYLERRSAFVYAATVFTNAGDFKDGQIYAEKAVAAVQLDRKNEPGNGEVYSTLGHIQAMQGNFADADKNLTMAEDYDRKSIAWAKKKMTTAVPGYVAAFQADLRFHALILTDMKRKHEAKKKLEEAEQLGP